MSTITLESIEAKQTELQQLIAKFKADQPRMLSVPAAAIQLANGEHYAGLALDADGKPSHHVILLPGDNDDATHAAQLEWAKSIGGDLPSRVEQALLWERARDQFKQDWYWSNETHHSESGWAWYQTFNYGYQNGACQHQSTKNLKKCMQPLKDSDQHPFTKTQRKRPLYAR